MNDSSKFRNWKAVLNLQPPVGEKPLQVSGEYFLDQRCGSIRLREAIPPGIILTTLLVEIVPDGDGDGGWEFGEENFKAADGQYDKVQIRDDQGNSTTVEVQQIHLSKSRGAETV